MKTLVICDDHPMYSDGLVRLFETHFKIHGLFNEGLSMLNFLKQNKTDILLLDLNLPDVSGFELLEAIKKNTTNIKVIVISMHDDPYIINKVKYLGAAAFCNKSINNIKLLNVVNDVLGNSKFISYTTSNPKTDVIANTNTIKFTNRESQIVFLIIEGLHVKQIAIQLNLSVNTVNTHKKNIFKKLSINSVGELIKYYFQNNNKFKL